MGKAFLVIVLMAVGAIYVQLNNLDEMWLWAALLPATYIAGIALLSD